MTPTHHQARPIPNLAERILALAALLPLAKGYSFSRLPFESTADVLGAITEVATRDGRRGHSTTVVSRSKWYRIAKGEAALDLDTLRWIEALFERCPRDILLLPDQASFDAAIRDGREALGRWLAATEVVATRRAQLEAAGKAYHRAVDRSPAGFPLITDAGWLPPRPLQLTRDDPVLPMLRPGETPQADPPTLSDMLGTYTAVKRRWVADRRRVHSGATWRLCGVTPPDPADAREGRGGFALRFAPDRYFPYVDTCEYLAAELADRWATGRTIAPGSLPYRGAPERCFDLGWRSAAVGVNCVLFLKNHTDSRRTNPADRFLVHRRGEDTLEAQNTNHVVPAGTHAPMADSHETDRTGGDQQLWFTVVREFCEELFDKEDLQDLHPSTADFLSHPKVMPYVDRIFGDPAVARIFMLGMGLDPATLKPEVLVAVVIDWEAVRRKFGAANSDLLKIEKNYEGTIHFRPLTAEQLRLEATQPADGRAVLPAGAACMLRAAELFAELYRSV